MGKTCSMLSYAWQLIDNADIAAVVRVLKSPFLTQGPLLKKFEQALCAYTGAKYAVAVANGTAALHLAVAVLGLKKGCSGVTSPITFLATANALIYNGIVPFFADIDAQTANMSVSALERTIQKDTKVIIPVHFAGRPAKMKEIAVVAAKRRCFVIEDAAHAIGSRYPDGGRVGNCAYSDMTVFSFHPVKTITTGEGGAVMTNNKNLYERLCRLRSHGTTRDPMLLKYSPGPWYYQMRELGFNYRLSDIQAALGLSQLRKIDTFIVRRRQIVARYNAAFKEISWLRPVSTDDKRCAYHLYVVQIDFRRLGISRKALMKKLSRQGIGTQVHYIPVHTQPYYRKHFGYKAGDCLVAEDYYKKTLTLPLYPKMSDGEVEHVIQCIKGLK